MPPMGFDDLQYFAWMSVPVWVFDPQSGKIRWANGAALKLWEAEDLDALCARPPLDLGAQGPVVVAYAQDQVRRGQIARGPWILKPPGKPIGVDVTVVGVLLPEGHLGLCMQTDPMVQQADPIALRGVEAILHSAMVVIMFDLDGGVLMKNPAAVRAFPILDSPSADRAPGVSLPALFETEAEGREVWLEAMEYGATEGERILHSQPQPAWHAYVLHRVLDPVTGMPALLFNARDVSERVQSEQRFRVLFEQSANAMLLYDPQTRKVLDTNQAAVDMLRLETRKQLVGMDHGEFYPPEQPDGSLSLPLAQAMSDKALREGSHRYEWAFRRADASELLVQITLSPVQVGKKTLLLDVWYDLSLHKRYERQLVQAKEVAEAANRAKSQFLANMSHEIRTPLNAIIGMTSLLAQTRLEKTQREYLEIVQVSSKSLADLVGDILDFSRIEADKLTLEAFPFNLHDLACKVVGMLGYRGEEKGLILGLKLGVDLPAWVKGDEARLRQVLINLMGNAIKFTEQGRVELRLRLDRAEGEQLWIRVEVADTGIGIPHDKLGRIFDAFSQADESITRRYGGSGLGLAISRRLVSMMGGRLDVESVVGLGSTFHFTVPLQATEERPHEAEFLAEAATAIDILLAEDNPMNCKVIEAALADTGHHLTIARDGREAVSCFVSASFDLVLMDMQMPEMDGLQATTIIRSLDTERHTPIVAMTANALPGDRERCLAVGMDDYLTKPVSLPALFRLIARVANERLQQGTADRPVLGGGEAEGGAGLEAHWPEDTPPETATDLSVFDVAAALAGCGNKVRLLRELARMFYAEWPDTRSQIVACDDPARLAGLAHRLKGSCGAVGLRQAEQAASRLEHACRAGALDLALREQLVRAGEEGDLALERWLTEQPDASPV